VTLGSGSKLLHYEVLGQLGAGAMGEVYRARDSKLGREVAIKVLPEHFAEDEERLRRFEREAKTLASLNHPNVAQIFGVDQVGETCFLVLELAEGESLDERLKRGPLPLAEALDVCRQIAEGLEAAHEAGVIHRDLKPANIRVTPEGRVKVLDFGLAKPTRLSSETRSTDSVLSTEQGRLLGTPTYMAPEQARGKPIDRRIDVWAFGCVLYECLTGKRAFEGETLSDVLGAVLRAEADLGALPAGTPAVVRALLARCLDKDPRRRLRDVGEARLVLEDPSEDPSDAAMRPAPRARSMLLPWSLAAAASLAVLALLLRGSGALEGPSGPVRLAVRVPFGAPLNADTNLNEQHLLALSSDGSTLALVVKASDSERLCLRRLDDFEPVLLEGTEDASSPFFSPDGRWVAFFARGKLCKVAVTGGRPIELADAGLNRGGVWCPNGDIVFSPSTTSGLVLLASQGGAPRELTHLDPARKERSHRWPALLPGDEIAFTVGTTDQPASYDDARIDAVELATGARRELLRGASMVKAAPGGQLVIARNDQLLALPLAQATGTSSEGAVQVLQGVAGMASSGAAYFDLAANGTLVYVQRHPRADEFELAWITRAGVLEELPFPPREYRGPRVSPDGTAVAVGIGGGPGQKSDVWIGDLATGTLRRLTLDGKSAAPAWTRDGARVAFCSYEGARNLLAWQAADGSGVPETLYTFEEAAPAAPLSFAPGDRALLFIQDRGPGHSGDILLLDLDTRAIHEIKADEAIEFAGALSPDGKWLASTSDESGRAEVYVQAFPGPGSRWQVSERGGYPTWSADGRELFYLDGRTVLVAPVQQAPSFTLGAPRKLFEQLFRVESETLTNYDVAADGRFLVVRNTAEEPMDQHVNVVLGWDQELRRALGE